VVGVEHVHRANLLLHGKQILSGFTWNAKGEVGPRPKAEVARAQSLAEPISSLAIPLDRPVESGALADMDGKSVYGQYALRALADVMENANTDKWYRRQQKRAS
jgi:hypothetical protein